MSRQEFKAELLPRGVGGAWSCIQIPFDVPAALGSKSRIPVKGTVNGFPFRSSVFPTGDGNFFLMVNKTMQQGARVHLGERVQVVLERDNEPRVIAIPKELAEELNRNAEAKAAFQRLPYSHQKEYVDWITEAKQVETRRRRIEKALAMLTEGRKLNGRAGSSTGRINR